MIGTPVLGAAANAADPLPVPYPAGVTADGILVIFVSNQNGTPAPAGWTQLAQPTTTAVFGGAFWKPAVGGESGSVSVASGGLSVHARMVWFPGVDSTSPEDVETVTVVNASTSATTSSIPTQTPVTNGAMAVTFGAAASNQATATPPTGYTEIDDAGGTQRAMEVAYKPNMIADIATGTRVVTFGPASRNAGVGIMLRPAVEAKIAGPIALGTTTTAAASSSTTLTTTATAVVGAFVLVRLAFGGNVSPNTWTCTDSAGNTYLPVHDITSGITSRPRETMFMSKLTTELPAGGTITTTVPSQQTGVMAADWWSGVAAIVDDEASMTGSAGATRNYTITTTNSDDLVIASMVFGGASSVTSQPAGWTALPSGSTAVTNTLFSAYQIVTSTGTFSWNPTMSTERVVAHGIAAFTADVGTGAREFIPDFGFPL